MRIATVVPTVRRTDPFPAVPLLIAFAILLAACESPVGPGVGAGSEAARSLAVGEQHACVLTVDGEAFCWGSGASGQLGNGSLAISDVPARVLGGHRFAAITAGGRHTCALTAAGDAYCWGDNRSGQLGDGTTASRSEPAAVAGGLKFAALSAGGFAHTCGLTTGGEVHCWGSAEYAQLGATATETCTVTSRESPCSTTPVRVSLGGPISILSSGFHHTCVLRPGPVATCWGDNSAGQMGSGTTGLRASPANVEGPVRFSALASGTLHTCGLDAGGAAHCWGDGRSGAVGAPGTAQTETPVPVSGGLTFRQISASRGNTAWAHTCAVRGDGTAYCWGANTNGQLGGVGTADATCASRFGPIACSETPRAVSGGERWSAIAAGAHFTCGISRGGAAFCWGLNEVGQLGTGDTRSADTPQPVSGGLRLPGASS